MIGEATLPHRVPGRPPAWLAAWPILPALVFLTLVFVYPVAQLLWLYGVDRSGALTGVHYARLFA